MIQRTMTVTRVALAAIGLAALTSTALAQEAWKPAAGPLMTRWAKDVSPTNALPDYPRPQLVRKEWQNLNGLWDYAITPLETAAAPSTMDGKILVPYPVESALSGVMKTVGEKQRLWYRRTFEIPRAWAGQRIILHFGAVDWEATVHVNGKQVAMHRGGFDPFSADITAALKEAGPQEVVVNVFDPTDAGKQAAGKQVRRPGGIMYTPTTGIWQTVWIEPLPKAAIDGLKLIPDIDAQVLNVTVAGSGTAADDSVTVIALDNGAEVSRATGKVGAEIKLPVKSPKLWAPDAPHLYDLKIDLTRGGQAVDSVASYFGMRKTALGKDEKGVTRLMLNNKFVFQAGPLDQGFWPDGLYTAPTDAALKFDIEVTKKLGFNMTRKHVKVEPARWYYWCDKLGLLVWQDMPSSRASKANARGNDPQDGVAFSPEAGQQFEAELKALVDNFRNHPSIIMWVVFNEGWGQHDTVRLTKWVKEMDPSRLVNNASGWTDRACGDVHDMHKYPEPGSPKPEETRAAVLGEFGGLGLGVDGHTWTNKTWGYQGVASSAALTRKYVTLWRKVHALKDDPGLSAAVYTQITDVETEANGLLTYDRAVTKVDVDAIAAAHAGRFAPPPELRTLVATSQEKPATWRYTFDKLADGWEKAGFDAAAWKEGPGGFGTAGTPGAVARTVWKTPDIYLRREVTLPDGPFKVPALMLHHDEAAEIYINGVLAAKVTGHVSDYEQFELTPEAVAALKPGKNLIAVHCHQTMGGEYIDVGLVDQK